MTNSDLLQIVSINETIAVLVKLQESLVHDSLSSFVRFTLKVTAVESYADANEELIEVDGPVTVCVQVVSESLYQ